MPLLARAASATVAPAPTAEPCKALQQGCSVSAVGAVNIPMTELDGSQSCIVTLLNFFHPLALLSAGAAWAA